MIARSLFELSVDLKLIDKIPDGVEKMSAWRAALSLTS
jgi:hypothetical protein